MTYDIETMGKTMPFTVPQGFFEQAKRDINAAIDRERQRKQRATFVKWTMSAAAAIALAVVSVVALKPAQPELNSTLLAQNESLETLMSDEQLNEWIEISENDVFLSCEDEMENYEYNQSY
ncbi:MAG: hypothetical protein HUK11_05100 [Muribaculaceae bacterium]|nr:hypothetical protein [Muribaculaceae bacterium]